MGEMPAMSALRYECRKSKREPKRQDSSTTVSAGGITQIPRHLTMFGCCSACRGWPR